MSNPYLSSLAKVMNNPRTNYKGRVIEKINSHSFRVGRDYYGSMLEAETAINDEYRNLAATYAQRLQNNLYNK